MTRIYGEPIFDFDGASGNRNELICAAYRDGKRGDGVWLGYVSGAILGVPVSGYTGGGNGWPTEAGALDAATTYAKSIVADYGHPATPIFICRRVG